MAAADGVAARGGRGSDLRCGEWRLERSGGGGKEIGEISVGD